MALNIDYVPDIVYRIPPRCRIIIFIIWGGYPRCMTMKEQLATQVAFSIGQKTT
jgi:hypothetical protein